MHVAMELKHQYGGATRDGLFAAMPPLEEMRLLLSYVASRQNRKFPHKLMFIDMSKAYLHADVLNDLIYVELPEEMNKPNMCGRLLRALYGYGTRQAGRAWEEEYTRTLRRVDFQREKCKPCMYYHPRRDVRFLVHGDDFTVAGNDSEHKYVGEVFHNQYKTKVRGILGPDLHDMKAMTILNRIVEWTNAGIQYEADPRHVDLIIEELGLENANGSDVTGSKVDISETVGLDQGSKVGEILAEAPQTGTVVCMAGCPVQPPGVRRHRLRWVPAHTEVHQWRSGHAREPLVEDLGFDTDRDGALER